MRKFAFSSKLVLGSIAIVVLVMVASTLVVSTVVNKQNKEASFVALEESINVIRSDLKRKRYSGRPNSSPDPGSTVCQS